MINFKIFEIIWHQPTLLLLTLCQTAKIIFLQAIMYMNQVVTHILIKEKKCKNSDNVSLFYK